MWFLLKSGVVFGTVLLLLPLNVESETGDTEQVGALHAVHAAGQTIRDLSSFCERNPDTCETGRAVLRTIASRASQAATMVHEMLEEEPADPSNSNDDQIDAG